MAMISPIPNTSRTHYKPHPLPLAFPRSPVVVLVLVVVIFVVDVECLVVEQRIRCGPLVLRDEVHQNTQDLRHLRDTETNESEDGERVDLRVRTSGTQQHTRSDCSY